MPLSSSYLKIGHSRFYDLPAWAVYYVPDLFGVCQLFSFYGLVTIYASSSRLYCLLSRISAHHFFSVVFFSCFVLFASRNVLLFHDFRLLLLHQSERSGASLLNYTIYSVTGFLDPFGWWLPFSSLLFLSSSFCLKLSHGVYVRCLRGNLFPIFSLLSTV